MLKHKTVMNLMVAAAITALTTSSALASDVTLKMHHFLPPQANVPKLILDVWADAVQESSGGSLTIDRFPSMQLGGAPPGLLDQAIDGVADVVALNTES